jgi:hypothetical protein
MFRNWQTGPMAVVLCLLLPTVPAAQEPPPLVVRSEVEVVTVTPSCWIMTAILSPA